MLPSQKRNESPWYDPKDEPALERMHFFNGRWDQLNWYVELIAKKLSRLSNGEWTLLQEEVVAIYCTLSNDVDINPPSRQDLMKFQQEISAHFSHLRNGGVVNIGPLQITHEIFLIRGLNSNDNQPFSLVKLFEDQQQPIEGEVEVRHKPRLPFQDWRSWLLNHFAQLLGEFGSSIRQCPYCSKWFLQFRKNAKFCGRTCQNRAGAKANREKLKKAKSQKRSRTRPTQTSTKRKEG